jgi:hypothetical protein
VRGVVYIFQPEEVVDQVEAVKPQRFGLACPRQHIWPAHPLAEHDVEAGWSWIDHEGFLRNAATSDLKAPSSRRSRVGASDPARAWVDAGPAVGVNCRRSTISTSPFAHDERTPAHGLE